MWAEAAAVTSPGAERGREVDADECDPSRELVIRSIFVLLSNEEMWTKRR